MSLSREEIIRMAREAGLIISAWEFAIGYDVDGTSSDLQRFANDAFAAGAAAEREAILQMSKANWYKTQADYDAAIRARGDK